ncbi:MAG: hypothetical protein QOI63_1180 [Thermoplasmata archaeon]|jgi:dihydrofolate reductase|nr:hypothetical protein [Thermoplasmata archaeon]
MFNLVSADGYFCGPDGNLDFFLPDKEVDRFAARNTRDFDTVLMGRITYELFQAYWPAAEHEPKTSAEDREIAAFLNRSTKIVYSTTLKDTTWQNTQIAKKFDPAALLALKASAGRDIIVFGSGSVVRQLTDAGLIDEYQILVTPALLGTGRSLLEGSKGAELEFLDSQVYRSGNVLHRYAYKGPRTRPSAPDGNARPTKTPVGKP